MVSANGVLHGRRANATIGWVLVGSVLVLAVRNALSGEILWSAVAVLAAGLASAPALLARDWSVFVVVLAAGVVWELVEFTVAGGGHTRRSPSGWAIRSSSPDRQSPTRSTGWTNG